MVGVFGNDAGIFKWFRLVGIDQGGLLLPVVHREQFFQGRWFDVRTAGISEAAPEGVFGDFGEVEMMVESRLGPADAASKRSDLLEKAYALGQQLVAELG